MYDSLNEEEYLKREVFARYGIAMYHAQCLERSIGMLLGLNNFNDRKISKYQVDHEINSIFSFTFGKLISQLKMKDIVLDQEMKDELEKALIERNRLAHDYWWENAVTINQTESKKKLIEELSSIYTYFMRLDIYFTDLYEKKLKDRYDEDFSDSMHL